MSAGRAAAVAIDRRALLIGVWDYARLDPLNSPKRDLEVLRNVLEDSTIGDYQVDTACNPHHGEADDRIAEFFHDARPAETLLLYLSGHGIVDGGGNFYFATVESDRRRPSGTAVSGEFLRRAMSECRAGTVAMLVDCCDSGAIIPLLKGTDTSAQGGGRRRAILTATLRNESASQGHDRRLSLFTEAIVDGLVTGRADPAQNGLVTAESLFVYVQKWMVDKEAEQHPDLWAHGMPVIARTPRVSAGVPTRVQPPPIDRRVETSTPPAPDSGTAAGSPPLAAPDRAARLHATLARLAGFLKREPRSQTLRLQRAWIHSELGEHCTVDEAVRHYELALSDLDYYLAEHPEDPVPRRLRGNVLRMLGRYDDALADLSAALAARPDDSVAYRQRGDVLRMLLRYDAALADLNACLARRPDDAVALRIRGDVLRALGRYAEALTDFDHSRALRPLDEMSGRIRDDVERMVEQSRSIVTRLDRILQRVPGDRVALVMRARAYRVVGQYDRALQEVNRLLATRPDDIAVRRLRGEIQYAMADYGPALADFKTVLAARPGDPVVEAYAEHAGQALATAGFRPRHRR